ncbi:peptide/nickel transport system substrate-binding protein [Saccharopolyspora lacisalsi]|uniref:Peptide/nickel transport system substrate-binding protein n=1 Tax=Halosaccharopolyspora lacisalsi TaxID=1000566 RepID=A0A839DSC9_9PSEU|nr:ABC transporter substrate-binding protein [Halosaccharopolyspora lacisalsi]MBA8823649.1 peptide/nickel transport system substrate-binding protein [Halosaccharopolyspora lacisalsi]
MGRKIVALLAASLMVALVPAVATATAAPAAAQQDGDQGATLRVGLQQEFDSLNPFLGFSLASTQVFKLIYPTLTTYAAEDFGVVPDLATEWKHSRDELTWTFTIRRGVKWSDGEPVTAHDVAYTFNRMMTDPAAATANGNYVDNFAAVTAPDDRTVVIRTEKPQATMLSLAIPIVPEHVWSKIDDVADFANQRMPIVGSGPFVATEYRPQQSLTLKTDEDFWRGPAKIDELRFVNFENSDAAVQALRKGEIDVVRKLTPTQFDALAGASNIERVEGQGRRFFEVILNPGATNSAGTPIGTGHPALRDVRVRRAIDRAINREVLVERVLGGYGQLGGGYLPPIFADYHWTPPPRLKRPFDIPAANRALDAAGYLRGPDGTRRTPEGEPLNFEFVLHGDEPVDARVGEYLKGWLSRLGINVTLQPVSDNQVNERTTAGDFDMVISGWSANPDPDYVLRLQTCSARPTPGGGGLPDSFLCDRRYDDLYARQLAEFDHDKRVELVKQAQRRFHTQATGLILFYPNSLEAYRSDRFGDFTTQPADDGVITGQQSYWGYYQAEPTSKAIAGTGGTDYGTVALVLGVVIVLGGGVTGLVALRRRATAGDRE